MIPSCLPDLRKPIRTVKSLEWPWILQTTLSRKMKNINILRIWARSLIPGVDRSPRSYRPTGVNICVESVFDVEKCQIKSFTKRSTWTTTWFFNKSVLYVCIYTYKTDSLKNHVVVHVELLVNDLFWHFFSLSSLPPPPLFYLTLSCLSYLHNAILSFFFYWIMV